MIERNVYAAYAPRGPGVMCALLYIEVKLGVHVRYVGSRGCTKGHSWCNPATSSASSRSPGRLLTASLGGFDAIITDPRELVLREDGVLPKNSNVGCRLVAWVPFLHCLHF